MPGFEIDAETVKAFLIDKALEGVGQRRGTGAWNGWGSNGPLGAVQSRMSPLVQERFKRPVGLVLIARLSPLVQKEGSIAATPLIQKGERCGSLKRLRLVAFPRTGSRGLPSES